MSAPRLLDLFSGIGGFSLGLERAGMRTVAFCESDAYCRRVLARHWPHVPVYPDVRLLTARQLAADGISVDVVCGGFPCQPFSSASAGQARGARDDRYLWPEMARLVSECQPAWVICENVTHLDGLALREVVSDLESFGYEVAPPLEIPACAVGHGHWRPRLWIVGHADRDRQPECTVDAEMAGVSWPRSFAGNAGAADGLPRGMDGVRRRALGNAVVPQIPELIGRAVMEIQQ